MEIYIVKNSRYVLAAYESQDEADARVVEENRWQSPPARDYEGEYYVHNEVVKPRTDSALKYNVAEDRDCRTGIKPWWPCKDPRIADLTDHETYMVDAILRRNFCPLFVVNKDHYSEAIAAIKWLRDSMALRTGQAPSLLNCKLAVEHIQEYYNR